jgi:hypothetical protein
MAMAPSRGGAAFTSPPYAPLNHGASLGERHSDLRNGHKEGEPAMGRHRAGTLNEESLLNGGQERANSGFEASFSGRPQRTMHRRDIGALQHTELGNADRQGLPTIDETARKAGGKVGPVSWGESLKYAAHSWFLGFWEALKVHRTVRIFVRFVPPFQLKYSLPLFCGTRTTSCYCFPLWGMMSFVRELEDFLKGLAA